MKYINDLQPGDKYTSPTGGVAITVLERTHVSNGVQSYRAVDNTGWEGSRICPATWTVTRATTTAGTQVTAENFVPGARYRSTGTGNTGVLTRHEDGFAYGTSDGGSEGDWSPRLSNVVFDGEPAPAKRGATDDIPFDTFVEIVRAAAADQSWCDDGVKRFLARYDIELPKARKTVTIEVDDDADIESALSAHNVKVVS